MVARKVIPHNYNVWVQFHGPQTRHCDRFSNNSTEKGNGKIAQCCITIMLERKMLEVFFSLLWVFFSLLVHYLYFNQIASHGPLYPYTQSSRDCFSAIELHGCEQNTTRRVGVRMNTHCSVQSFST